MVDVFIVLQTKVATTLNQKFINAKIKSNELFKEKSRTPKKQSEFRE